MPGFVVGAGVIPGLAFRVEEGGEETFGPMTGLLGGVVSGRVVGDRFVFNGVEAGGIVVPPVEIGVEVILPVEFEGTISGLDVVVAEGGVYAQIRGGQFGPSHGFLWMITVVVTG